MGDRTGTRAGVGDNCSSEGDGVRFTCPQPAIAPMSARELLHYDAAMGIAEERYPLLPADAPEWEQLLRVRLRIAYHAVILAGWSDSEHQRRMGEIRQRLARESRSANNPEDARGACVEVPANDFEALVIQAVLS